MSTIPADALPLKSHEAHDAHHDADHKPSFFARWFMSTNHKDIGTLYLIFAIIAGIVGGALSGIMRAELMEPGIQYLTRAWPIGAGSANIDEAYHHWNVLITGHGLIMVFGAIMPAFVGFANWMIPLQIGAADMAFARMNNLSFWLLIPAALMLVSSFFMPGGAPAAGWTLYAPLTLQMPPLFTSVLPEPLTLTDRPVMSTPALVLMATAPVPPSTFTPDCAVIATSFPFSVSVPVPASTVTPCFEVTVTVPSLFTTISVFCWSSSTRSVPSPVRIRTPVGPPACSTASTSSPART